MLVHQQKKEEYVKMHLNLISIRQAHHSLMIFKPANIPHTFSYRKTLLLSDTNIASSATMELLDSPSATVNLLSPCMLPSATATHI